jgi:A-kinase anchor protein 14
MAAVDESVVRDMVQLVIIASLKEVKNETISHNFKWPNVVDFTPDRAQSTIEQFIQSWELDNSWLHHTIYSGIQQDTGFHCYKVIFSQPSRRKPVPRATACVFFYILTEGLDAGTQVKIFYIVEGQRVVLRPNVEEFREKWLKDVINSKLAVNNEINV